MNHEESFSENSVLPPDENKVITLILQYYYDTLTDNH